MTQEIYEAIAEREMWIAEYTRLIAYYEGRTADTMRDIAELRALLRGKESGQTNLTEVNV